MISSNGRLLSSLRPILRPANRRQWHLKLPQWHLINKVTRSCLLLHNDALMPRIQDELDRIISTLINEELLYGIVMRGNGSLVDCLGLLLYASYREVGRWKKCFSRLTGFRRFVPHTSSSLVWDAQGLLSKKLAGRLQADDINAFVRGLPLLETAWLWRLYPDWRVIRNALTACEAALACRIDRAAIVSKIAPPLSLVIVELLSARMWTLALRGAQCLAATQERRFSPIITSTIRHVTARARETASTTEAQNLVTSDIISDDDPIYMLFSATICQQLLRSTS